MNREDIVRMARECGFWLDGANQSMPMWVIKQEELERFAALVASAEREAWKYDVTYNQNGTVSVALPDGDELRIVLPNQQKPYCWTWDVWVGGGKWRAEYGWEKPTEKVVNLQPLYTTPTQHKPLSDEEIYKASTQAGMQEHYMGFHSGFIRFAKAIEVAHGIKD